MKFFIGFVVFTQAVLLGYLMPQCLLSGDVFLYWLGIAMAVFEIAAALVAIYILRGRCKKKEEVKPEVFRHAFAKTGGCCGKK